MVSVVVGGMTVRVVFGREPLLETGVALIVKVIVLEVPPPGAGLVTVTVAVPATSKLEDGTIAVNSVLDM